MNDRRHLGRDEETVKGRAPTLERHENSDSAAILELQGRAGNRAVAAMLEAHGAEAARSPVQRQPEGQALPAEPANEGKTSAAGTMTLPELDMTVPIASFQQQVGRPAQPKEASGEVMVTVAIADLDPRIAQAAARGDRFAEITVTIGAKTITMHEVVFSGFNIASDYAALTLNFTSIEPG